MVARQPIPKRERERVFTKFGGKCTGWRSHPTKHFVRCHSNKKLEIDHIHELRHGGTNDFDNFQLLCHECHRIKTKANRKWQVVRKFMPSTASNTT